MPDSGQNLKQRLDEIAAAKNHVMTKAEARVALRSLGHLTSREVELAFNQAEKMYKFMPQPSEILDALKIARAELGNQGYGHSPAAKVAPGEEMTAAQRAEIARKIDEVGQKLKMPAGRG